MSMTMSAEQLLQDLLMTPEGRADPYPGYRALQETAPFFRNPSDGLWYASRYDTCRQILLDDRFGHDEQAMMRRRPGMTEAQVERMRKRLETSRRRGFSMVTENPPDHTRLRRLVSRAFTTPRIEGLRERVVQVIDARLDELAAADEVDLMRVLAYPLPITVIGDLVGVPFEEREQLRAMVQEGMLGGGPDATEADMDRAERNFEEMEAAFDRLIAERRTAPQDDMLSALIAVHDEDDGRLSEEELRSTIFLLFFAGFVTTTNVIGNGLLALFRQPGELARLWSDPGLVVTAVEEMLRYDSPVPFVGRDVMVDTQIEGVNLSKGEHVILLLSAANRDESRFADPDRFDVGRTGTAPITFGWGIHHCLGAPLARMELQAVFSRMIERFSSLELLDPDPPRVTAFLRGVRSLPVRVHPRA